MKKGEFDLDVVDILYWFLLDESKITIEEVELELTYYFKTK